MPHRDSLPALGSNGVGRMLWRCRLKTPPSISLAASSGRCSFPIAWRPTAKRVLKPGGHLLFNVWDRIEENVFADDVTNALARIFPNDPPRFMARTPHGYHGKALIRSELEEVDFSRVTVETRAEQSRASSPRIPAVAYCQGTLLRNEIEVRAAGSLESATDYVASAITEKHGNGEIAAKINPQTNPIRQTPSAHR